MAKTKTTPKRKPGRQRGSKNRPHDPQLLQKIYADPPETLYSLKDAAKILNKGFYTLQLLCRDGRDGPQTFKIGGARVVRNSSLREWVESLEAKAIKKAA